MIGIRIGWDEPEFGCELVWVHPGHDPHRPHCSAELLLEHLFAVETQGGEHPFLLSLVRRYVFLENCFGILQQFFHQIGAVSDDVEVVHVLSTDSGFYRHQFSVLKHDKLIYVFEVDELVQFDIFVAFCCLDQNVVFVEYEKHLCVLAIIVLGDGSFEVERGAVEAGTQ